MSIDTEGLKDRGRRLAQAADRKATARPEPYTTPLASMTIARVVLRSCDPAAGEMWFHRIRYASNPPVVGQYEAYGELERGYPLETAIYADYTNWVWPDSEPLSTLTVPLLAIREGSVWILMVAPKFDGSLLPADEPANECNFG